MSEPKYGPAQPGSRPAARMLPARSRHANSDSAKSAEGPADAYLGPVHTTGKSEIGRAAWYNWVGSRTASGEILDWITPTAAHRSLPLASYAKVTNLDTGRAVVVKINDRGPYRRRFIIDLSPRAAEEIGVVRSGIAAVSVEPIASGRAPNRGTAPASETHVARADSEAIPYNQPAWVDPRLERPASKKSRPSTEARRARQFRGNPLQSTGLGRSRSSGPRRRGRPPNHRGAVAAPIRAIPYNNRLGSIRGSGSKDETAPSTEEPVARANSGAIPYNQPAWVDPRLEQR